MRIHFGSKVKLKGQRIIALVDTRASHAFNSKHLVSRIKLWTEEFNGFKVAFKNGAIERCTRIVPNLDVILGGHTIKRNFYVANIHNDIILGMPWINSSGRFIMDGPNSEIFFTHEGYEITLKGLPDGSPKVVTCKKMDKIPSHHQGEWIT